MLQADEVLELLVARSISRVSSRPRRFSEKSSTVNEAITEP
jgi:hypothetical protein